MIRFTLTKCYQLNCLVSDIKLNIVSDVLCDEFKQDILTSHHQRETVGLDPHVGQQIQEHDKLHKQIKYNNSD